MDATYTRDARLTQMRSWCLEQLAPWEDLTKSMEHVFQRFRKLNLTDPNVFLFEIENGSVFLVDKPESARHAYYENSFYRAERYCTFFERVVKRFCPLLTTTIAVFVGDDALEGRDVPVFAFQKKIGNISPLIPDIDLIDPEFLTKPQHIDPLQYEEKYCSAIFAGSTTGGTINLETIRTLAVPRIRAGAFFRGCPNVYFHLPKITQCDSPAAEAELREMGFGGGEYVSWSDQFGHRFLLSMDGNGPSPARIAVGLNSNSVLMQYQSPSTMYYFSGLLPWYHYLPIANDQTVVDFIEQERKLPGKFKAVSDAATAFVQTFLVPESVMLYMSELLQNYDRLIRSVPVGFEPEIYIMLHVAWAGNIQVPACEWSDANGVSDTIEGLLIDASEGISKNDLMYRVVLDNREVSPWCEMGHYCGTQGDSRPILGFEIALFNTAAENFTCVYAARYRDGSESARRASGMCCSKSLSELTAVFIGFESRENADDSRRE